MGLRRLTACRLQVCSYGANGEVALAAIEHGAGASSSTSSAATSAAAVQFDTVRGCARALSLSHEAA